MLRLPLDQADPQDQHFLGTSENGVRIKIAVAIIAFGHASVSVTRTKICEQIFVRKQPCSLD